ncbi:MAG: LptF/LptG family permease [Alistipes sp.]|nr:LptF/LptG family permease [Alistipes sp.]MBR5200263.1 LptF/LptG family permease [Alistipes sp.]
MKIRILPSLPGLRTLDKYILGKFLRTYIFGILMMIIILVVFDYVEKVDDFTELKAPWKAIIWDYYMNFIPLFISQFSALFTFIAVIFFTSKMAMQTEIVAILSGGVSFRRFMWPYVVGATLITAMSLALSLWIIPEGQKTSVEFESKYLQSQQSLVYPEHVYRQIEPNTYAYVRGYSPGIEHVPFFAIERFDSTELVETLDAANASFDVESRRWTAPRYMIYSRGEDGTLSGKQYRNLDTLINLDVRELGDISGVVKTLTYEELNEFLDQQRSKGSDEVFLIEVERHARFSYPISTFILTIIGVALASRKVRGGMGMHIGIGIALCFIYLMVGRVSEQIAISGSIEPWIGVWLPNIIFAIIAIIVYRKAPK